MLTSRPLGLSALTWSANAAEMMYSTAASHGGAAALIEGGQAVTYAALAERAGAIAQTVLNAVSPGERVAIFLRRGTDAAAAFFGVLAAGAVAVIVNETLRSRQIEHILKHADTSLLLTSAELCSHLSRLPVDHVAAIDVADIAPVHDFEPVPRVGADVAQIVYTSGSTGLPKGVTLSHSNLWAGMSAVVSYLGITPTDRIVSLLPFSFDYGLNQLLCCAGTGAALVVERSPVPQRIIETVRRERVSILPAVPPLWLQLLGVTALRKPLPSLRLMTNTGGHLPIHAVHKLRVNQPHADLVLMYGLTEAFRSTYLASEAVVRKPSSIGRAIPGAEILVLDESCRPCGPGQFGQLVHRGPTVALGYWNDPDATAARFRPHPLRPAGASDVERVVFSGDLVYRDEDGDLFFVGRHDTMIKTLGYRVSPDEVADVLYASGEVLEAVVVSESDEERGARIVAYVVLTDGGDARQLAAFCARELPRYMQPSRIEVRTELPRTTSGKHDAAAAAYPDRGAAMPTPGPGGAGGDATGAAQEGDVQAEASTATAQSDVGHLR